MDWYDYYDNVSVNNNIIWCTRNIFNVFIFNSARNYSTFIHIDRFGQRNYKDHENSPFKMELDNLVINDDIH